VNLLTHLSAHPPSYAIATGIFLRMLGLVYLIAFWSLAVQIRGLIGHDGILPAGEYLAAASEWASSQQMGLDRFRLLPTLCWFSTSDAFLVALPVVGAVLAALLVAGVAPVVVLPLLWVDYLSLSVACGEFLSYQWDALLLETGLLAIFLAPLALWLPFRGGIDPSRISRWLLWWLLFRLLFGSGIVKLASGDPTWANLTALAFHYETQPLPTPIAWYAHHLPLWFQKLSTASTLAVELVAPWFIFGPRRLRLAAAGLSVGLQVIIWTTGNYTFFNLLTIALCLLLLDDRTFERVGAIVRVSAPAQAPERKHRAHWPVWITAAVALVTVPVSFVALTGAVRLNLPGSAVVERVASFIAPFRSVNRYGLFAVMTTTRPEIIVEGSNDGTTWLPYEFKYKAGDLRRRPAWVAPYQPRLDWQMWFAALGQFDQEPWFRSFCGRLLQGSPSVLGLLASDPFQGSPPKFVRGELFRYRFSDVATRQRDHTWWTRERIGPYSPVLSFKQ
jgi:hypothetical protein